jgi:hypothetical protein
MLNVELSHSRLASHPTTSRSRPKNSSSIRSESARKKKMKTYNTSSDDVDESTGSSTGSNVTPMPIMNNSTQKVS